MSPTELSELVMDTGSNATDLDSESDMDSSFLNPRFFIEMFLITTYAVVMILIYKSKRTQFQSGFYTIYKITAIFDITGALSTVWIRADVHWKLDRNFEFWFRLASTLTGTNFSTHNLGILLSSIAQWWALSKPHNYNKYWNGSYIYLFIGLEILFSFATFGVLFFFSFTYAMVDGKDTRQGRSVRNILEVLRIQSILESVIVVTLSAYLLLKSNAILGKLNIQEQRKRLRTMSLRLYIAVNGFVMALECIFEVLMLFIDPTSTLMVYLDEFFSYYFFIMMTMNSISLTIMSSHMRKEAMSNIMKIPLLRNIIKYQEKDSTFSQEKSQSTRPTPVVRVTPVREMTTVRI